jgi:hypothetical protein
MKKTIKKEVRFCDKCGKEDSYPTACMKCGIEMCYECQEQHGKSYNHGIYVSGSGDGFYCKPCDLTLTESGRDKRHNAYLAIKSLSDELEAWSANFKARQKSAEKALEAFR